MYPAHYGRRMRPISLQQRRRMMSSRGFGDAVNEIASTKPLIKGPGRTKDQILDHNNQIAEKSTCESKREQETEEKTPQSRKNKGLDGSLVGARIKVWWSGDKRFYKGIIDSYDSVSKMHKVAYDDGDVEVLLLKYEKWQFISKDNCTLKKFHKKDFSHNCSIGKLYEGSIATGKVNFTSTEEPRRCPPSPTERGPGAGTNPFSANLEGQRQSKFQLSC